VLRRLLLYALLIGLSLLFAVPFMWMISSSLKSDQQIYRLPPVLIPNPMRWQNYIEALQVLRWDRMLYNTLVRYAVPNIIGTLVSSALVAYGFARIRWRGREIFFFLCIATMMIPFQVTMVPLYINFAALHWVNTYLPLVVPAFFGNAYFIFMLRQFFLTIPNELSDAAKIDGCSELGILWRIILPLAKPALAVVTLFQFMGVWSDYLGPLIYLQKESEMPIALGLELLRAATQTPTGAAANAYPYLMAMSTCVVAPVLLVFFFAQRSFIEGIAITGLKQ